MGRQKQTSHGAWQVLSPLTPMFLEEDMTPTTPKAVCPGNHEVGTLHCLDLM